MQFGFINSFLHILDFIRCVFACTLQRCNNSSANDAYDSNKLLTQAMPLFLAYCFHTRFV